MKKHWIPVALNWLTQSLDPVPHELNELDWKTELTGNKERLIEHLIAFANHPSGGFLTFGVQDDATLAGVGQSDVAQIVNTLANLGRDAVEPPLAIDHAVVDFRGAACCWFSSQSRATSQCIDAANPLMKVGYARAARPARHPDRRLAV